MNIRGKLLLFVALIAGTFCALVTKTILNQIPDGEEASPQVQEKTIPTMVAKRDLLPGDEITPQNIRFDRLPESQVPTEAVNYYSDAKHRTLVKGVGKGQLISIYDLNESESSETGYYTPLNSSCASFLVGSVIGSSGKGEEFLEEIKRNITPGVDRVDFYLSSEKREENLPEGGKPLQRTSVVKKLLGDVDVYQVRVIQKVTDLGQTEPRLELSFILNDSQLEMIEEAEREGRVTIEFSAGDEAAPSPILGGRFDPGTERGADESAAARDASPLFEVEPASTPAASPADDPAPAPVEENVSPAQPVSDSSLISARTADMNAAPPVRKNAPRPRMSVPRPLAAAGD